MRKENLKKLRLNLHLTQGAVAEGMGLTRQTVDNIESGRSHKPASLLFYELYLKDQRRRRDYAKMKRQTA